MPRKRKSTSKESESSSKKKKSPTPAKGESSSKKKKSPTPAKGKEISEEFRTFTEKSNVKKCIKSVKELADNKLSCVEKDARKDAEDKYTTWEKDRSKPELDSNFDDELFIAVYVLNLYETRIKSFYKVFKDLGKKIDFTEYKSIMSLGCGACPEIVAFLHYYEIDLGKGNCENLTKIIGIDEIDHWKMYLPCINEHFNKIVEFKKSKIDKQYLSSLEGVDLIVMSYSCGKKSEDIWEELKDKCKTVIVLHNKSEISDLGKKDYKMMNFIDNQNFGKFYAYYTIKVKYPTLEKKTIQ